MARKQQSAEGNTVIRAFELPLRHAEPDIWPLIREGWKQATMLANWCARHLLAHDVVRMPHMQSIKDFPKMPALPKGGLYAIAGEAFGLMMSGSWWAGQAGSFAAITKSVMDYWLAHRSAVLWYGNEQPPRWRYPYPFPIRSQEWCKAGLDASGKPYVVVNLPSGTPRKPIKARLDLRGGQEFGRQMALFRRVVEGDLPRLQLVIRQQGCSTGCHRATIPGREPARVMVKMVATLPVLEATGQRTLTLITDPQAFWVAELDGRPAWVLNADHVRRACEWLAVHESRRQRMAQDRKAERRLDVGREDAWLRSLERCCDKHARRMSSWLHESAAHLAQFAQRNRVGLVLYRDLDRGFAPLFPWHRLKTLLADKLKALGIHCQCASDESPSVAEVESLTPLENDECLDSMKTNAMAARRLLKAGQRSASHPAVCPPSATAPTSPPLSPSMP